MLCQDINITNNMTSDCFTMYEIINTTPSTPTLPTNSSEENAVVPVPTSTTTATTVPAPVTTSHHSCESGSSIVLFERSGASFIVRHASRTDDEEMVVRCVDEDENGDACSETVQTIDTVDTEHQELSVNTIELAERENDNISESNVSRSAESDLDQTEGSAVDENIENPGG